MIADVEIPFNSSSIPSYYTEPEIGITHPAILLIHDIWGLNDHIKDIAGRFVREGYAVLIPNLLADTAISEKVMIELFQEYTNIEKQEEVQKKMKEVFAPTYLPGFAEETVAKLQECFAYLQKQEHIRGSIAAVGFSFGGTYTYALAAAQPQLKAAVPFYGHAPVDEKMQMITCPILAFYGGKDTALSSQIPELNETMALFHKKFQAVEYPDVGNEFFNDVNPNTYNNEAAEDAWSRMLDFLKDTMHDIGA